MDYTQKLRHHYRPQKGWINDPNGLVYFQGYYHVFYQHCPDNERPWIQPMHWGHARTKDFLSWEELPVALYPDRWYDEGGCWSGTTIVKEDILYLFYASVRGQEKLQTVSVAWSEDGIHFEKYAKNPVIDHYPPEGGPDFRDPALCCADGRYYCVMAAGNPTDKAARLLLYRSDDLFSWDYLGVMSEWADCHYAECPSFMTAEDGQHLLTVSVCPRNAPHFFSAMYGSLQEGKFAVQQSGTFDRGPDQYAGQVFRDHKGRHVLMAWIPGWGYESYASRDVGCLSLPREIRRVNGRIVSYPVEEVQHLLRDEDPAVIRTGSGFEIRRARGTVVHTGAVRDLKLLRDGYVLEVFVNGGEDVYSVLL